MKCPVCATDHSVPVYYCAGNGAEAPKLSLANMAEQVHSLTVRLETVERELRIAKQQIRECVGYHARA